MNIAPFPRAQFIDKPQGNSTSQGRAHLAQMHMAVLKISFLLYCFFATLYIFFLSLRISLFLHIKHKQISFCLFYLNSFVFLNHIFFFEFWKDLSRSFFLYNLSPIYSFLPLNILFFHYLSFLSSSPWYVLFLSLYAWVCVISSDMSSSSKSFSLILSNF